MEDRLEKLDVINRHQNIPQSVTVDYGENNSLFVSVKIDEKRAVKFEFKNVDETFPTIVLEKFLEPFCVKIAAIAEKKKAETDNFMIEALANSAINKTIDETGLENVAFLFDGCGELEIAEPSKGNDEPGA